MASVPSNQLRDAMARVSRSAYDRVRFGRAWQLAQIEPEIRLSRGARPAFELRHYGTVVLRTEGSRPVYAYMQSPSDRDGINGMLRLMGVAGRYGARFEQGEAMWRDGSEEQSMGDVFDWGHRR